MPELSPEIEELCRAIPEEKDPVKMLKMVERLNALLEAKGADSPPPASFPAPNTEDQHAPDQIDSRKSA